MTTGSSEYFDSNPAEAGARWANWCLDECRDSGFEVSRDGFKGSLDSFLDKIYGHPSNPKAVEFKSGADAILSLWEDEIERPKPVAKSFQQNFFGVPSNPAIPLTKEKLEEVKRMLEELGQTGGVIKWTV